MYTAVSKVTRVRCTPRDIKPVSRRAFPSIWTHESAWHGQDWNLVFAVLAETDRGLLLCRVEWATAHASADGELKIGI